MYEYYGTMFSLAGIFLSFNFEIKYELRILHYHTRHDNISLYFNGFWLLFHMNNPVFFNLYEK